MSTRCLWSLFEIYSSVAAIAAVKASANKVVNQHGNLIAHERFHKRCELVVKYITKIQQALSGETELELLNPLRRHARQKIGQFCSALMLCPVLQMKY